MSRYTVAIRKAHPKRAMADVVEHAGMLWVTHADLIAAGYRNLESFSIVKLNEKFYELQAHVGQDSTAIEGGAWWIEEVDPEAMFDDVETTETEKQLSLF